MGFFISQSAGFFIFKDTDQIFVFNACFFICIYSFFDKITRHRNADDKGKDKTDIGINQPYDGQISRGAEAGPYFPYVKPWPGPWVNPWVAIKPNRSEKLLPVIALYATIYSPPTMAWKPTLPAQTNDIQRPPRKYSFLLTSGASSALFVKHKDMKLIINACILKLTNCLDSNGRRPVLIRINPMAPPIIAAGIRKL